MPVAQVSTAPSREQYEQVAKVLDLAGRRPEGLILHAASELPSGEVQIVDVYESHAAMKAFAESRLFPAFAAAGLNDVAMADGRPVAYETFELVD